MYNRQQSLPSNILHSPSGLEKIAAFTPEDLSVPSKYYFSDHDRSALNVESF